MEGRKEEGKREERAKSMFEEGLAENFPNLRKAFFYISKAQQTPNRIKSKRSTPRHIILKLSKPKTTMSYKSSRSVK